MIRPGICLAIGLLFLCEATAALAQGSREPVFTATERAVIARNQALSIAFSVDPEVVRRILDEMAQPKPRPEPKNSQKKRDMFDGKGSAPAPIDLSTNPDIDVYLQRASPEAAYDLFQILKRVGAASGPKR
ncbi:MAG: hypothetical protein ABW198_07760 [Pseudorhodoplanes sp.]